MEMKPWGINGPPALAAGQDCDLQTAMDDAAKAVLSGDIPMAFGDKTRPNCGYLK
jgi:hypothetical protein